MVKAVLFDLDGVLMETELQTFQFYQQELRHWGIELPDDAFRFKAGRKSADFWRDALTDEQRNRVDTLALTAKKRAAFAAEPARYIRRVPGGPELLAALRGRGLKLALASQNEPRMVHTAADWLGIRPYFDAIFTIADIRELKPAPEIYLLAAARLNVPPVGCIVIEDSADGIEAAKNAGMYCFAIRHPYTPPGHLKRADRVVKRLADLTPTLIASALA